MAVHAELISIGDELLIGQVVNTNVSFLNKALNEIGVSVERITTIGDDPKIILQSFERAWSEYQVVIVTGGLGPTHDDISRSLVAQFFNAPLESDARVLERVRARFARSGYTAMPKANEGQALVPKGFLAMRNDAGTAPGLYLHQEGKSFAILPGVPHEMEWIARNGLLDLLKQHFAGNGLEAIQHRTLITTGIGESMLAEQIGDVEKILEGRATLAFLPRSTGVRLRISAKGIDAIKVADDIADIERQLRERAARYIVGTDQESLTDVVVGLLRQRGKTLATAESCTGGMISAGITSVPGSSAVYLGSIIAYDNLVKTEHLHVASEILEAHGTVSLEVAAAMAEGALRTLGSDYAIGVTGISGPGGGTATKPVGLTCIALAERGQATLSKRFQFGEDRDFNRERAVASALDMLRMRLLGLDDQEA